MYKLVALFALLAVCSAAPAPKPQQLIAYSAPALVSQVVAPAVSSYSSYSTSVVHGTPVVSVPVVRTAPVVHSVPVVHTVPLTYSAPTYFV